MRGRRARTDGAALNLEPLAAAGAPRAGTGLELLADDGDLSAILGVVTIKLHDDTLKTLIDAKILTSDLPQHDKKRWTDQLQSLPTETTKHLTLKLVNTALSPIAHTPDRSGPL